MRTTKSTIQALERLAAAMEVEIVREGSYFIVLTAPLDSEFAPLPNKSAGALANLAFVASFRDDWEELRQATRYDPGIRRGDFRPDVPTSGLSGWQQEYLERLSVTEVT